MWVRPREIQQKPPLTPQAAFARGHGRAHGHVSAAKCHLPKLHTRLSGAEHASTRVATQAAHPRESLRHPSPGLMAVPTSHIDAQANKQVATGRWMLPWGFQGGRAQEQGMKHCKRDEEEMGVARVPLYRKS